MSFAIELPKYKVTVGACPPVILLLPSEPSPNFKYVVPDGATPSFKISPCVIQFSSSNILTDDTPTSNFLPSQLSANAPDGVPNPQFTLTSLPSDKLRASPTSV